VVVRRLPLPWHTDRGGSATCDNAPPSLCKKVPTISPDVEQVVTTALAKDPKQRFGSVLAFATALEQASQVKQPEAEPESVPVVPVSETTYTNQSKQPTEMATPPIPFPQQVTVGKVPVDTPSRQTVSEVSVDIPDPPHNLESGKIPPVGRSDDEDHPRNPSSLPEGMVHASLTPQEETAIPSPLVQTEKVQSGSQKTDKKSLLSRSAGQQPGKGIQSPISRPWYTLGKRDVLAVVLTAGLYQVVLWSSSLLYYLHLNPNPFVGLLILLVLFIVTGIIPVVFSRRKGFDGLVPVLLSGLACGILNLFNSIESISYPATTLIALAIQVFFLMLVAATYISIKNRVSGHSHEAHPQSVPSEAAPETITHQPPQPGAVTPAGVQLTTSHPITRRNVLIGLAGVVLAATGAVGWWELTHRPGTTLYTYRGHSRGVTSVAWSPDGTRIVSGSWDNTVQVWDATTGHNFFTYEDSSRINYITDSVAWTPDGKRIAYAGDMKVYIQDATDSSNIVTYTDGQGPTAWSPDSKHIVSVALDQELAQVRDATSGRILVTHRNTTNVITAPPALFTLAWSPHGSSIASGGNGGPVEVWDATSGQTLVTYQGNYGQTFSVAWSPDDKRIASGGNDRTVQVWQAA
jgi:WD domain, G-beta repeat/WD40-like Beta Propeller Repeat